MSDEECNAAGNYRLNSANFDGANLILRKNPDCHALKMAVIATFSPYLTQCCRNITTQKNINEHSFGLDIAPPVNGKKPQP